MSAIPGFVTGWFKSAYPTLVFQQEWIEACYEYLREQNPECSNQKLLKDIETQLLLSDLQSSVEPVLDRLLFSNLQQNKPGQSVLPGKKSAVLLQLVELEEVGHAAGGQLDTLKERRETARMGVRRAIKREEQEGAEGETDKEKAERLLEGEPGKYPRGMLKLKLSDGVKTITALERARIKELDLNDWSAGAKMLVKDARWSKGLMLLGDDSVVWKANKTEELEVGQEERFENSLRRRLMKPLVQVPSLEEDDDGEQPPSDVDMDEPPAPPPASNKGKGKAKAEPDLDEFDEFDEYLMEDDWVPPAAEIEKVVATQRAPKKEESDDDDGFEVLRTQGRGKGSAPPPTQRGNKDDPIVLDDSD